MFALTGGVCTDDVNDDDDDYAVRRTKHDSVDSLNQMKSFEIW